MSSSSNSTSFFSPITSSSCFRWIEVHHHLLLYTAITAFVISLFTGAGGGFFFLNAAHIIPLHMIPMICNLMGGSILTTTSMISFFMGIGAIVSFFLFWYSNRPPARMQPNPSPKPSVPSAQSPFNGVDTSFPPVTPNNKTRVLHFCQEETISPSLSTNHLSMSEGTEDDNIPPDTEEDKSGSEQLGNTQEDNVEPQPDISVFDIEATLVDVDLNGDD
jgi:hypothetical protein